MYAYILCIYVFSIFKYCDFTNQSVTMSFICILILYIFCMFVSKFYKINSTMGETCFQNKTSNIHYHRADTEFFPLRRNACTFKRNSYIWSIIKEAVRIANSLYHSEAKHMYPRILLTTSKYISLALWIINYIPFDIVLFPGLDKIHKYLLHIVYIVLNIRQWASIQFCYCHTISEDINLEICDYYFPSGRSQNQRVAIFNDDRKPTSKSISQK